MQSITPQEKLDVLAKQFNEHRKNKPFTHIPKPLWKKALELTGILEVREVANAVGCSLHYLHSKLKKQKKCLPAIQQAPQFIEVKVEHARNLCSRSDQQVSLQLQNRDGTTASLSFQGAVKDAFPLLTSIFGGIES